MEYITQEQNKVNDLWIGEIRGRMNTALELSDLPYESIETFYSKEEEDAAEIVQD